MNESSKDYVVHPEEMGAIHISEEVLSAIAASAAAEIDGVAGLMNAGKKGASRGVKITIGEEKTVVDISMEAMAGFGVQEVNVHVGGVSFAK